MITSAETETRPVALADFRSVFRHLSDAVDRRSPYSFVRVGDGEAGVLGFPDYVHPVRFMRWMANWFGQQSNDPIFFHGLKPGLERAILGADLLGTYRLAAANPVAVEAEMLALGGIRELDDLQKARISRLEWLMLDHLVSRLGPVSAMRTSTSMHMGLEKKGALLSLARKFKRISIISCRNITEKITNIIPDAGIFPHLVPGQFKFEQKNPEWHGLEPHYPVVFERIIKSIDAGNFEGLSLVGAGPCGKIYCDHIKRAGGMAFDIGSIFDLWAGYRTRSYMDTMQLGVINTGTGSAG